MKRLSISFYRKAQTIACELHVPLASEAQGP